MKIFHTKLDGANFVAETVIIGVKCPYSGKIVGWSFMVNL